MRARTILAEKLDRLFTMHAGAGKPLSNAAAAAAIQAATGVSISPAYLWQLRTGVKANPTISHLRAIAEFFRVQPSYLIAADDDPGHENELALLHALRNAGVRDLAMRASGLSPTALTLIVGLVDHVRRLQNLPPLPPVPTPDSQANV